MAADSSAPAAPVEQQQQESSLFSSIASFFLPTDKTAGDLELVAGLRFCLTLEVRWGGVDDSEKPFARIARIGKVDDVAGKIDFDLFVEIPPEQADGGRRAAHAEAPAPEKDEEESGEEEKEEEPAEEEEEEEEEPEDPAPAIREDCEQNVCGEHLHHFQHCQTKVEGGKGFPGEDCVEEFFHLLHCVDSCAAPKIFKKLA